MAATPTEDVIDVNDTFKVLLRAWKTVGGFALGTALLVGLITFVVPPVYEARFSVLFPRSQGSASGLMQLAASSSSDVQYLGGVVKSHDVRALIANKAEIRVKDVEAALDVNEMPERRQLEIAIRSGKEKLALGAVQSVLDRIKQLDQRLLFNVSDRISSDLAKEVQAKKAALESAQSKLAEFQKTAKTAPSSKEDFTGAEYLTRAEGARITHSLAKQRLQVKLDQAKAVGQTIDLNLPTGDQQITDWRKELLSARTALDTVKSKYQPGTIQVKNAQQALDSIQKAIREELMARVVSVEKGIDSITASLIAAEMTTKWELDEAEASAKVAPAEAKIFRTLLVDIRVADAAYEANLNAFRTEDVRNKVEKLQWSVLDEPYVLEEAVNKKYGLNMIAGFVIGMFGGFVAAIRRKGKS